VLQMYGAAGLRRRVASSEAIAAASSSAKAALGVPLARGAEDSGRGTAQCVGDRCGLIRQLRLRIIQAFQHESKNPAEGSVIERDRVDETSGHPFQMHDSSGFVFRNKQPIDRGRNAVANIEIVKLPHGRKA
jgi:hypothetical protein